MASLEWHSAGPFLCAQCRKKETFNGIDSNASILALDSVNAAICVHLWPVIHAHPHLPFTMQMDFVFELVDKIKLEYTLGKTS